LSLRERHLRIFLFTHPKIVQERFGYSSVAVTMDIYSHLMPNMHADAAARVDETLRAAINARARAKG
jgi:hypothetical protein